MMTCYRPMLKQHPLVIVGNTYLYAGRRALRCDGGWGRPAGHDGDDRDDVPRFRDIPREAGRDPATAPISLLQL